MTHWDGQGVNWDYCHLPDLMEAESSLQAHSCGCCQALVYRKAVGLRALVLHDNSELLYRFHTAGNLISSEQVVRRKEKKHIRQ